jgi:Zn-dependent peptidase ImmA (M78 family)/transcriptional regulator with XRE-family HTH domain
MMHYDPHDLTAVFGPASKGTTPEERARSSDRVYVRSLDQLALDSPRATGRRLSAAEALDAYGWDTLLEVEHEGAALLSAGPNAPGEAIRSRRNALNLGLKQVARRAELTSAQLDDAERNARGIPLQWYERIAQALGLDERFVSVRSGPVGDERLAVRLRTLSTETGAMSATEVASIAEAAWVATTQVRLERALGFTGRIREFTPSGNYGDVRYPPYMHGYWLADETRKKLHLGNGSLPATLREIAEDVLGIPVIQAELGEWLAGVTVQVGDARAIVANVSGMNGRNVYIRRATLAHELGHLLWDPDDRLQTLAVDTYGDLERRADEIPDAVEQRANAFSVQFIAPQAAVLDAFYAESGAGADGVGAVMERFGISFTAARYQIWNATQRTVNFDSLRTRQRGPSEEWDAKETYAVAWHPLKVVPSRAGRFSGVVVRAAQERLISWDTAGLYLQSTADDVRAAAPMIKELFPRVFSDPGGEAADRS